MRQVVTGSFIMAAKPISRGLAGMEAAAEAAFRLLCSQRMSKKEQVSAATMVKNSFQCITRKVQPNVNLSNGPQGRKSWQGEASRAQSGALARRVSGF